MNPSVESKYWILVAFKGELKDVDIHSTHIMYFDNSSKSYFTGMTGIPYSTFFKSEARAKKFITAATTKLKEASAYVNGKYDEYNVHILSELQVESLMNAPKSESITPAKINNRILNGIANGILNFLK